MIRHIVMYKLNEPTEENKKALMDKFLSMKGKIPCLISLETGKDILGSERSCDICLVCTFENMDRLNEYRGHPVHLPVVQFVKGLVKASWSADYEFEVKK